MSPKKWEFSTGEAYKQQQQQQKTFTFPVHLVSVRGGGAELKCSRSADVQTSLPAAQDSFAQIVPHRFSCNGQGEVLLWTEWKTTSQDMFSVPFLEREY